LTDADVQLYKKTMPSLRNTQEQNKLITAITIRAISNNLKSSIATKAA
jgi:hypothetical protein